MQASPLPAARAARANSLGVQPADVRRHVHLRLSQILRSSSAAVLPNPYSHSRWYRIWGQATGIWQLPGTGDSENWTTVTEKVFLTKGRQVLRFEIVTGGFNLNWIEIAPATSGQIANGTYKIVNRNSSLALEANTATSRVVQDVYTGAANERWNLVHWGAGQYSIVSVSNNWSWNSFYDRNGEPLMLAPWRYDGHPDRRYTLVPDDNGFCRIHVADGGLTIQMEGASFAVGAQAQQQESQGEGHQQWGILPNLAPAIPTGLLANWGESVGIAGDHSAWKTNFGGTQESYQINLSWTTTQGAVSYNIGRARTSAGPYTTIATAVTATRFTDAVVPDGGSYYYVVSA